MSPWVGKGRVTTENADRAIAVTPPRILHVGMVNAVEKKLDEFHIVHPLVPQVRRVIIKPKRLCPLPRRSPRSALAMSKGDFSGMNLKGEVDAMLVEGVQDRSESLGEIIETLFPSSLGPSGESVNRMPDAGTCEAVYNRREVILLPTARFGIDEISASLSRSWPLFGGLTDFFRIPVAPKIGKNALCSSMRSHTACPTK